MKPWEREWGEPQAKPWERNWSVPTAAADDPGAGKGTLGEQWREAGRRVLPGVRPAAIAAGASAGALAALPVAPSLGPYAPVAPVVGGALGAAAVSAGYDNVSQMLQAVIPGFKPLPDATVGGADAIAARAADEAAFDAATSAVAGTLGFPVKHFLSPLIGKVFGVRTPASLTVQQLAKQNGIELGAVDVGNAGPRILSKVLGVFPLTGAPLRIARDTKEAQLQSAVRNTLNTLAPTATTAQEMGIDMARAAQQSNQEFKNIAAILYDNFRNATAAAGPIVPTSETKAIIQKWADDFAAGQIPIAEGKTLKGGVNEQFEQFLQDAQNLPTTITIQQYERLQQQLEGFIDKLNPDQFTVKRIAQIKAGMERDLNAIQDPTLKQLKTDADTFFSNGIVVFQTPTANKFRQFDKNIFKAGPHKPGTLNPDELMRSVFNADSPIALRQLRALVGDDAFRRAGRTHLQSAFEESWVKEVRHGEEVFVFNPEKMADRIGLSAGRKDQRRALEEILRGTGVQVRDVEDLLTRIKIAKQADPSAFVSRRVTLGGVAALTAIGGAGAAAVGGPVAAAGSPLMTALATWTAYNFSKVLANPEALKALTRAFQPNVDDLTRRAVYFRFLRQFGDARDEAPQ